MRTHATAFSVALLLVVAGAGGCGRGGGADPGAGGRYGDEGTATTDGDPTPTTAGTPTEGAGGAGPGGSNRRGMSTPAKPPTGPGGGGTGGGTTNPSGDDAAIKAAARSGVGGFARVLLQPRPAGRLVVEVLQQSGAPIHDDAVNRLVAVLEDVSGKDVRRAEVVRLDTADRSHSAGEIVGLADSQGKAEQGGGQAVLRVLYLDGGYAGSESVLGVAVRGDVVAIFPDAIADAATPVVPRSAIENAVVIHEGGHVLGLVDLAVDTGRDDPEHPGHSQNRNSVMYWAVESSLVAQLLDGPPPTEFDASDRRDLATIRGGG